MWMGDAAMASLLDQIGLEIGDVHVHVTANMSFLNSHGAWNPKDAEEFRILCDSFGRLDSTGVYLYDTRRVPRIFLQSILMNADSKLGQEQEGGSGTNESVNCIYIYKPGYGWNLNRHCDDW